MAAVPWCLSEGHIPACAGGLPLVRRFFEPFSLVSRRPPKNDLQAKGFSPSTARYDPMLYVGSVMSWRR